MRCARCAGLKVLETMMDGGMRATAYRCVHCGDLSDDKILWHRKRRTPQRPSRPRTPIFEHSRAKRTRSVLTDRPRAVKATSAHTRF
jgi:hypothetical protein